MRQLVSWWHTPPADPGRAFRLAGVAQVLVFAVAAVASWEPWGGGPRWVREPARWVFAAAQLGTFAAGYRAVRALAPERRPARRVAAVAAPLAVAAVCVRPFHSTDLFTYINVGWQQAEYGQNPYAVMLYETPNFLTDPMFHPVWLFVPTPYGFLFSLEAWGIGTLAGRDYALTVALHKAVAIVAYGLLGAAVWAGLKRFRVAQPVVGLYLCVCNPLMLVHYLGHAHNDLQMALGVTAAVAAAAGGRWLVPFPLLAAGALVKAPAALAAPFLALYLLRRHGWWRTVAGLALAGGLVAVSAVPYLDGMLTRRSPVTGNVTLSDLHNSLASAAHFPVEVAEPHLPALKHHADASRAAVRWATWAVFGGWYLFLVGRRVRTPGGDPELARDVALALLAFVLCSPKFHVWYVGWLVPLAVWLPPGDWVRRAALALAAAGLLAITALYQAHFANALLMVALPVWWAARRRPPVQHRPATVE